MAKVLPAPHRPLMKKHRSDLNPLRRFCILGRFYILVQYFIQVSIKRNGSASKLVWTLRHSLSLSL